MTRLIGTLKAILTIFGGIWIPFRNKKNGQSYMAIATVIDTTNGRKNERMVLYLGKDRETGKNRLFVRECLEFLEKFSR